MPAVSCGIGVGDGVGVGGGAGVGTAVGTTGRGVGGAGGVGDGAAAGKVGVASGGVAGGVAVAVMVGRMGAGVAAAGGAKVGAAGVGRPTRVGRKSGGVAGLRRGRGRTGGEVGATVAAGIGAGDSSGGGKGGGGAGGWGCRIKSQARKANSNKRNATPKQCQRQGDDHTGSQSWRNIRAKALAPLNGGNADFRRFQVQNKPRQSYPYGIGIGISGMGICRNCRAGGAVGQGITRICGELGGLRALAGMGLGKGKLWDTQAASAAFLDSRLRGNDG